MKNLFLIMGCVLLVVLSTSCAKDCKCTRFEDGKKVSIFSTAAYGEKFFDKADCEYESEIEHKEDICKVNCRNEAGPEPDWNDQAAYQAWLKAISDCRELNTKKDVKVKVDCKLH